MGSVHHVVDTLRLIVDGKVRSIVVSQTHSRHEVGTIYLVAVQNDRCHVGDRQSVELALGRTLECARRSLRQVVSVSCLVVDDADVADCSLEEGVLSGCIGVSSLDRSDVKCLAVRVTYHLVQRTVVLRVKRSCRTVCGNAFHTMRLVNVTWAFGRFL